MRVLLLGASVAVAFAIPVRYQSQTQTQPPPTQERIDTLKRECDTQQPVSCRTLGTYYEQGFGVERDYTKALNYFDQACKLGGSIGCAEAGRMHRNGLGTAKDDTRAADYYEKACTVRVFNGCQGLAQSYLEGWGRPKDAQRALSTYTLGCRGNNPPSCLGLGIMLEGGLGVAKDEKSAADNYEKACTRGMGIACNRIGLMYQQGRGLSQDNGKARDYFNQSCKLNDKDGCSNLQKVEANAGRSSRVDTPPVASSGRSSQPSAPVAPPKEIKPAPSVIVTPVAGTAFAVSSGGLFLTSYHVVDRATNLTLHCSDGQSYQVLRAGQAPGVDLAVLQTQTKVNLGNVLPLAYDATVSLGQKVFTVGYPLSTILGSNTKYTDGTISSLTGFGGDATLLQMSVPIQPGNSGGPLLDERGRVIGIVNSTANAAAFQAVSGSLPQSINWATKVSQAASLLPQVKDAHDKGLDHQKAIDRAIAATCQLVGLHVR